jgi:TrmH family RNA methyltransferase
MNLDDVKKLQHKKYRQQLGHFLVEGEHLVLELQKAARSNPQLLASRLYVTERHAQWQSAFDTRVISERQMAQISDTATPQGIVAVVPFFRVAETSASARAIYLHDIQDPGNLGTVLRTLAWFGGFRCLLSAGSVDPYNPKVVRASMGAIFHVPLELDVEAASLRQRFARVACLDMQGKRVQGGDFANYDCYLFGNEARGLPRDVIAVANAQAFTIAGCGAIESLNLAAAVNICVWELCRQP